ncbi:MAG: uracil-DNA glycosylase [Candidatus Omnitrophica bacterium]|nr:uracil-DNA glycosylase [Candidatus Omnitrophota bacterium]
MEKIKKELREIIGSVKAYMEAEQVAGIEEFYLKPLPKTETLEQLRQELIKCRQCPLYKTRINPVLGEGNPRTRLVFVGEAPGREEDLQGLPFVGRAGELLTRIIEAMGLKRKDVYISNVLKCRPPQNRNPLPSEIAACRDYIGQQLEIINPRVICCLGKFACQALLNQDFPITKLRGKFQDYRGIKVMPTFHPAYLLRNPSAKRLVWEDMQKIMVELKKT